MYTSSVSTFGRYYTVTHDTFSQVYGLQCSMHVHLLPRAHAQGVKSSVLSVCLSVVVVVVGTKCATLEDLGIWETLKPINVSESAKIMTARSFETLGNVHESVQIVHFSWPLLSTTPTDNAMLRAMRMPKLLAFCSRSEAKAAAWTCARGVCAPMSSSCNSYLL